MPDLEIDKELSRVELEIDKGSKVAVPLGTAAHYGFLRQMDHFGIDLASLDVVNMASAGRRGGAGAEGGRLRLRLRRRPDRMKEHGNVLLTGAEKEELGILVFDVTSAPADFVAENPDLVAKFLAVTAAANAKWNANPDEMLPVIAKESGMDAGRRRRDIATLAFPTRRRSAVEQVAGRQRRRPS